MAFGRMIFALGAAALLAACDAPQSNSGRAANLAGDSTPLLCSSLSTAGGADLLAIEAELGARGAFQCTNIYGKKSFIGERTESSVGRSIYARVAGQPAVSDDMNCSDFASAAEAQKFFLANGGPTRDPHRLDGDGDGNACEWGKTLRSSVKKYKPKPIRYTAPRRSTPTCHTGPRGGRYYYSASGNKVYGC